ncbi:hypothetical protein WN48_04432, partial [Eufriesea mexicana]
YDDARSRANRSKLSRCTGLTAVCAYVQNRFYQERSSNVRFHKRRATSHFTHVR